MRTYSARHKQTYGDTDILHKREQSQKERKKERKSSNKCELWAQILEGYMVHSFTWSPPPSDPIPVTLILYSPIPSFNPHLPILKSSWWRLFCQAAPRQQHQRAAGWLKNKTKLKTKEIPEGMEIFSTPEREAKTTYTAGEKERKSKKKERKRKKAVGYPSSLSEYTKVWVGSFSVWWQQ